MPNAGRPLFKIKTMRSFLAAIVIITLTLISFTDIYDYHYVNDEHTSPLELIKKRYLSDFDQFEQDAAALKTRAHQDGVTEKELQEAIIKTRLSYKKIEYLLEYIDPENTIRYINGAPLPKLEPHTPNISVIKPNGLQTLDEMIFLEGADAIDDISLLADQLYDHVHKQVTYQSKTNLEHRYIIEAIRYGVLRVFTLGLTGFDTPGSVNAMEEAMVSLSTMKKALSNYHFIKNEDAREELNKLIQLFDQGIVQLDAHPNFDDFDRLTYYREVIRPLYAGIKRFHDLSAIELKKESDKSNTPHNYDEKGIFNEDFFNRSYYTQISESDMNNAQIKKLGKTLFYDPSLSKEFTMSCATCHDPHQGFADGLPKSKTNTLGKTTRRHSPTLLNAALYGRYFWDMREYDLERQVKHVASDSLEFNHDLLDMADRLKTSDEYVSMFKAAYGDRDKYGISSWSISNALAVYVANLTSFDSEFDRYARGDTDTYDQMAQDGFNLFMGKAACGTCHFAPSFSGIVPPFYKDSESEVLGVTVGFDTLNPILDHDPGRMTNGLIQEQVDFYNRSMKTVTVRNAAITAPYMHNGSFKTLEDIVNFYNLGGGAGMGLDVPHQTLPDSPLGLNSYEVKAIVKFMHTLTDTVGMTTRPQHIPKVKREG